MNIQRGATFNLDAKPALGIVVETGQTSFRAYFPGFNGEDAEVLEFENRTVIDTDELNVLASQTHRGFSGNTIPEGGEFVLDDHRAVFAVVRIFRVVPFGA